MQNMYRLIFSALATVSIVCIAVSVGAAEPSSASTSVEVEELPQAPRVAVLQSRAVRGKRIGDMQPVLEDLGWPFDSYLNTHYQKLLDELDRYDVVIFSTVHNFDRKADLATGADRLRSFVESGGALVLCDLNYDQQTDWLSALDPQVRWEVKGEKLNPNPDAPLRVAQPTHPLLDRVETPSPPWSQVTRIGSGMTPLYVDVDNKPVVAYMKLGKGVVFLSNLYHPYGWPDARFLENLVRWQAGIKPRPAPALEAVLAEPMFRGQIQSKDLVKRVVVQGHCDTSRIGERKVEIRLSPSEQTDTAPIWIEQVEVDSDGKFRVSKSAENLPTGEYDIHVRSGAKSVELALRVLPPADWEFFLDDRGVAHVNGEAIFPLGMFHVSPLVIDRINKTSEGTNAPPVTTEQMLSDLESIGINAGHYAWQMPKSDWIARLREKGMWVIPTARTRSERRFAARPDRFRQLMRDARPHDAVLMWYGVDEPTGRGLSIAMTVRNLIERLDPHRPFSAAVNRKELIKYTLAAYDIYMPDKYLLSDKNKTGRGVDLRPLRDQVVRARQVAGRNVAYWPILQAFTIDKYNFPPPTLEQIRAQAFISIASGASGIFWYAYWDGFTYTGSETGRNQWVLSESPVLESLRTVHAELQEWIPIVCHGRPGPEIDCNDDRIVAQSWLHEGKVHVLAVNAVDQAREVALQGPAGQAVMDQAASNVLRFGPLEMRTWVLPALSKTHDK